MSDTTRSAEFTEAHEELELDVAETTRAFLEGGTGDVASSQKDTSTWTYLGKAVLPAGENCVISPGLIGDSLVHVDAIPYNMLIRPDALSVTSSHFTFSSKPTTYTRVYALMGKYEQPRPATPQWPSAEDYRLRVRLTLEESFETFHDGFFAGDAVQILDGLCDMDVVNTGAAISFGFDYDSSIAEVDRSNSSKMDPVTGRPNKDQYGKVIKPPTYSPANLVPFVGALINTRPPYDTRAIVREEFSKVLAKRIALVDWALLANEVAMIKMADAAKRSGLPTVPVTPQDVVDVADALHSEIVYSEYAKSVSK
jgi:predicted HAD superfamily Cof-like phosphohydrolase